jgi:hypothetical protein
LTLAIPTLNVNGFLVMVMQMSTPTSSRPPARKYALSKLPEALTIIPVTMDAAKPKVLPPNIKTPVADPTMRGSLTKSLTKAVFNPVTAQVKVKEVGINKSTTNSLLTTVVNRTTLDNSTETATAVHRLPCSTASGVKILSLYLANNIEQITAIT